MYSLFVRHNIGSIASRSGNLELDDLLRPGRPLEVDVDHLKQLIEQDPRLNSRCLTEQLGCSHTAVEKHLNELGKTWKYGVWIPHQLSPHQLQCRVDASHGFSDILLQLSMAPQFYHWR